MIEIFLSKDMKAQFEKNGLLYPKQKTTGKYGLRNSTLLDRDTLEESEKSVLDYLKSRGIINVLD